MQTDAKYLSLKPMFVVLAVTGLATACTTTSTDPADGGFFNGIQGLSSGAYQERLDSREAQLASLRASNAELSQLADQQKAQQATLSREIRDTEAQLAATQAELSSLRSRIASLQASGQQNSAVSSAQAKLNSLQNQTNSLAAGGITDAERARLAQIAAETKRVQQSLDAAIGASVGL